ncbi:unnamed protein product [Brachionus calyciflorus]|uniref:Major facilitator superfamily (MFS) profile domain-containing protein n=1 Tax=Brachionus calyciflorus TaxID=104777 RepID=A0A813T2G9_9BILA|nr:unnamed protein product [Brachionus calyciflorus]
MINFEYLLKEINDFGLYQKVRYLLICLAALLPSIVTYMHSFIAPKLNKNIRCKHPYLLEDSYFLNHNLTLSNVTSLDSCSYTINNEKQPCEEWVFDRTYYQETLTEQWSLVCSDSGMIGSLQTIYFSGYLVGSIIMGIMADHFGRRPIMLSSFVMIILGSAGVAFGPQEMYGRRTGYILYALSRFIIACGTRGINVTGFVLGMEMMGPSKRTFAGIVIEYFFAIGQIILIGFVYVNYMVLGLSWRYLAIALIFLGVPFLSYFFILPESPRWLLSKDRKEEAYEILKKVAKTNGRVLKDETWQGLLIHHEHSISNKQHVETALDAVKSPKLVIMSSILFLNWIINNFLFYGVGLKMSDLGVNPYFTFTIGAIVEIIAYAVTHVILDRIGRKAPYLFFLFFAGVSCLSIAFTKNTFLILLLAMSGKFCASAAYAIIYLYTSELFPTSIRNSGMGACSMMARIGSMIAPKINDLSSVSESLPFLIFGISGIIGSMSSIILPETLNRELPENIKEANSLNKLGLSCKANFDDGDYDESEMKNLKN